MIIGRSGTSSEVRKRTLPYKKMSCNVLPNCQNDGFVAFHKVADCGQPYDDAGTKGSVDRAYQSKGPAYVCGT